MNQLMNVTPTVRGVGRNFAAAPGNDSVAYNDVENVDVTLALDCVGANILHDNKDLQEFICPTNQTFSVGEDDVWLVPVYIGVNNYSSDSLLTMKVWNKNTPDKYRTVSMSNLYVKRGWQVLVIKNTEDPIGANEYGRVGTTASYTDLNWESFGGATPNSSINMISLSFNKYQGTKINIGTVHTAPPGWCKAAIMFGADDMPKSVYEVMLPVIESYGWKMTGFATASYSSGNKHVTTPELRDMINRGHSIWGHNLQHFRLKTTKNDTDALAYGAEKRRQLREAQNYFLGQGMTEAARCMAFPFNGSDDETRAIMSELGYVAARASRGRAHQSWLPGLGKYDLPSMSMEADNSWAVDTEMNGVIQRGQATIFYGHNAVVGGAGTDTKPTTLKYSFFRDHLIRQCDMIKEQELLGNVVVPTVSEYFKLCGMDLLAHNPLRE